MKRLAGLLLTLALSLPLAAAAGPVKAVPLEVSGDVVQVVRSFPVKVTAQSIKNTTYVWSFPDSVKAEKRLNVLTILTAPKGSHRITVTSITIDFKKEEVVEDTSTVEIHVGDVPIPPGPDPGPGPKPPEPTPLVKALKAAFALETDPDKAKHMKTFATIFAEGSRLVADGKVKTVGALDKAIEAGAVAGGASKKLPGVQGAVSAHMKERGIPRTSSTPIDDSNRDKIMGALTEVSLALKEVAP